jgi:hypothetical protein
MGKNVLWIVISVILFLFLINIYPGMMGKVIDAETGEPIEGAVIMMEWTETKGVPGMTYTESYKVIEVVTDKEGRAWIRGVYNPFVNLGSLVVYKKGYVAWGKDYIFPDYKKRTDFRWCCFYKVFKLERFKPEYSYIDHTSFIDSAAASHSGHKELINEAIRWEEIESSKERDRKRRKR